MNLTRLCFVGNMLGKNKGFITTQGQIVADLLAADENYQIKCVSSKINRLPRMLDIVSTLIGQRRAFDAVIVEVYSGLSFVIAEAVSLICKINKIPLVLFLHGGNLPAFAEKNPSRLRRVLRRADFLVAPSGFLATELGGGGFAIRVIPNVLNIEDYSFRERRNIAPRLIWMRSFHEIYNPRMAIETICELRKKYPRATLVMAGKDKGLEGEMKSLTKMLDLKDAVRFAGFLDEPAKIREFSAADIYLNTNRIDNMPVSVLEARALGLPVVSTDVGGLRYLIDDGENGLLCRSENSEQMCRAVETLLEDAELTAKISRQGRILAENSAWSKVKKDWEKLFAEAERGTRAKTAAAENLRGRKASRT